MTASAVSKWRKGGVITEMHATALAAIAGLDGEIVVRVMEEQAETPAQRRVWRSVLDRLSAAAAVLMLVVFAAPGVARAKVIDSQGFSGPGQPHSVYYVPIGLGRTSGLAATTSALCLLKTSLRSLCVGRPSAPSLTVDIKVNRLHLPPDMTNQQHDELGRKAWCCYGRRSQWPVASTSSPLCSSHPAKGRDRSSSYFHS